MGRKGYCSAGSYFFDSTTPPSAYKPCKISSFMRAGRDCFAEGYARVTQRLLTEVSRQPHSPAQRLPFLAVGPRLIQASAKIRRHRPLTKILVQEFLHQYLVIIYRKENQKERENDTKADIISLKPNLKEVPSVVSRDP